MLIEYIEEAMSQAVFEKIDDQEPYYGEIPQCKGVWASAKTLAECNKKLREVLESWLFVRISKGMAIPVINTRHCNSFRCRLQCQN